MQNNTDSMPSAKPTSKKAVPVAIIGAESHAKDMRDQANAAIDAATDVARKNHHEVSEALKKSKQKMRDAELAYEATKLAAQQAEKDYIGAVKQTNAIMYDMIGSAAILGEARVKQANAVR